MAPLTQTRRGHRRQQTEVAVEGLVTAARELFASRGYADTSLDDVVAAVGVTKGSLYHHFEGKADLFEAVFEEEAHALHQLVADEVARRRDPWQAAYAGIGAFLRCSQESGIQQIILLDGPSVLGWEKVREIEGRYGLGLIRASIQWLMAEGQIPTRDVDVLAHLVFGALAEGALLIARAKDENRARRTVEREMRLLVDGLAAASAK